MKKLTREQKSRLHHTVGMLQALVEHVDMVACSVYATDRDWNAMDEILEKVQSAVRQTRQQEMT